MSLLGWIRAKREAKLIEQHAESLVARQVHVLREAIERPTAGLALAEARGYIRAKSTKLLADAIAALSRRPGVAVPDHLQPAVLTVAADRATQLLLERRRQVPTKLRRAA
jgi:hypothetical protein